MTAIIHTDEYQQWIISIKQRIQVSQIKAAITVNREMLELYWFIGEQIVLKQETANWGDGVLKQMSLDLLIDFPEIKGFSRRNLFYMRKWFLFWSGTKPFVQQAAALHTAIVQQVAAQLATSGQKLVSQIPWGHNLVLLDKFSDPADALFYVQKTIENNWSRSVLTHQIESGLHLREGRVQPLIRSKPNLVIGRQNDGRMARTYAW